LLLFIPLALIDLGDLDFQDVNSGLILSNPNEPRRRDFFFGSLVVVHKIKYFVIQLVSR